MKALTLFLLCLTLVNCGSDNQHKVFDGQAKKVSGLNNTLCLVLEVEIENIKTDEHMFENYGSPDYFVNKYLELKVHAAGFWNSFVNKTWWNVQSINSPYEKEKFLKATADEVPAIESLTCQNYVKEWHEAVNERLKNGPYNKSLLAKAREYIELSANSIGNWLSAAFVIFILCATAFCSYSCLEEFVIKKSLGVLFGGVVLSGAFGLMAILIDKVFFESSISHFTIWWISSLLYSFTCLIISIMLDKKNKKY